jgi:class 3 adenylate cyclase/tetratricopeptide (TPR) repeat protein
MHLPADHDVPPGGTPTARGAILGDAPDRPRVAPPFVGRVAHLDWLVHGLDAVLAGRPRVALVLGDAGIGKTRLLRELQAVAGSRDVEVCVGRGYEHLTQPFLPFVEALGPRVRAMPAALARALGTDADVLRGLVDARQGTLVVTRPGDDAQTRLLLAISRAVLALARRHPMVFVLDDLHWLDQASLEVFTHLVLSLSDLAGREPVPLMLVGSARPVERQGMLGRVLARFQREDVCQMFELGGLSEPETQALVRALGVDRPSHQMIATVRDATRGNPLFIQEVVHHLVRRHAVREQGGFLTVDASPLDVPLPADVTAAMAARTQEVGDRCRATLSLAAVLGDPFAPSTLAAIGGLGPDELRAQLEEGERHGLIVADGEMLRFWHPLIRQVLYVHPTASERRRLHARIAAALLAAPAAHPDDRVIEIAHHLIAAGSEADADQLIDVARRAGDRAFASASFREAARFYQAALAAAGDGARLPAVERARLHYQAGLASFRDQDVGPCLDHYEQAIAGFRASGDIRGLARAVMGRTRASFTLASVGYGTLIDPEPLLQVADRLADEDPVLCGFVRAELAQVFWTAQQPAKACEMAAHALEAGQRAGAGELEAEAHRAFALAYSQTMRPVDALASLDAGLVAARRAGSTWLESQLVQRRPLPLFWLGRVDEAESATRAARDLTRRLHDWGDHSLAEAVRVCVAVVRGDFEAAERHAHQVSLLQQRSRYPWAGPTALPALACARALRGAWSEAEDALAYLVEPGQVFEDPGAGVQLSTFLMRQLVRCWSSGSGDVRARVREGLDGLAHGLVQAASDDVYGVGSFCAVVELAEALQAPALAETPYAALVHATERGVVFSSGWVCLVPRVLGVAATLQRQWDRAEAFFEQATSTARTLGARPELARSELGLARMLVARGRRRDRPRAVDLVNRATGLLHELGMEPFKRAARALAETLQTALAPVPRRRAAAAGGLTRSELALLQQVVRGRDDRAIARALLLRPETVARQVRKLLAKIDADTRLGATSWALEHGVVRPEDLSTRPAAQPPSVATLLFTDLAGSTSMFDRLGDTGARSLLRTHDAIVREGIVRRGGTEVKYTGDGFLVSFASAANAVECAIDLQRVLAAHNQRHPGRAIRVRMGLNAGEPIAEEGDLFGATVNAAARICARAKPGQILVAEVVRQLCTGKDVEFVDRGRVALRGLSARYRLFEVPW